MDRVLAHHDRSPIVQLNRAAARSYVDGPAVALADRIALSFTANPAERQLLIDRPDAKG